MKLVGIFFSFFRYNVPIAFLTCTIFYFFFVLEKADDVVKGSNLTGYHLFYKNVSVSLTKHIQHRNNIFITSAIIQYRKNWKSRIPMRTCYIRSLKYKFLYYFLANDYRKWRTDEYCGDE